MAIKFKTQPVAKNATSRSLDTLSTAECKLQDKTVEYTENSQYEILPDEGYDGIAKVDVTVNVPIPEPKLQSKNYNIVTNGDTTITPDAGFVGINGGTISVNVPTPEPKLQEKSTTISQNGASSVTPDSGYEGLSKVDITVQVPEKTIQANKTVSITTNGQTIVSPDPSNDGMAQATVDVNVSGDSISTLYISRYKNVTDTDGFDKVRNAILTNKPFLIYFNLEEGNVDLLCESALTFSWGNTITAAFHREYVQNPTDHKVYTVTITKNELPDVTEFVHNYINYGTGTQPQIYTITVVTQEEFDAIPTKDPNTQYLIVE